MGLRGSGIESSVLCKYQLTAQSQLQSSVLGRILSEKHCLRTSVVPEAQTVPSAIFSTGPKVNVCIHSVNESRMDWRSPWEMWISCYP